jgi:hypothetical protein
MTMATTTHDQPPAPADPAPGEPTSPQSRGRSVWVLAILAAVLTGVGTFAWLTFVDGAPRLGDRGAATAHVSCGLLTVEVDGWQLRSESGDPGAAYLQDAAGQDGTIAGRVHLDERTRLRRGEWRVRGRFLSADGTTAEIRGDVGGKFSRVSVDCVPTD